MATVVGYNQSVKKKCTCHKCSAIIEYVQNEVQDEKHYDYGGGCDMYYYISCPNCGNKVSVKGY
jgi:DNA-directed RNA polymerase subunit RPC12/RpoP